MAEPIIHIDGMEQLLAKIKSLEELRPVAGRIKAAAAHVKGKLMQYPSARHGRQPFKTEKQRRYFFYALNAGIIEVPYRRGQSPGSRNLKQSWAVAFYNEGLTAEIGNNAPYGPVVQGAAQQSQYHRDTGWQTDQDVAEQEMDTVVEYVKEGIDETLAQTGE